MDADLLHRWGAWLLDQPWAYYVTAGLLAFISLRILYAGLFGDRARRRRRCPKCWYDLRGSSEPRCPECGFIAKYERQLHRSRRRWGLTLIGCLPLVAALLFSIVPSIRRYGWYYLVPTKILLVIAEPGRPGGAAPSPTPIGNELLRRKAALYLTDAEWSDAIVNQALRFRRRWPVDIPFQFEVSEPNWFNGRTLKFPGAQSTSASNSTGGSSTIYRVPCAPTGVDLDVEIWPNDYGPRWGRVMWHKTVHLPVTVVPNLEDAVGVWRGVDANAAIRSAVHIGLNQRPNIFDSDLSVQITLSRAAGNLDDVAVAFDLSLAHGDELVEQLRHFETGSNLVGEVTSVPLSKINADPDGYSIRVRSDVVAALLDWERPKCWVGEFDVPFSEILKNSNTQGTDYSNRFLRD